MPKTSWPDESGLQDFLWFWQKHLRLMQWRISVRYARTREMSSEDGSIAWGRLIVNENHLKSQMLVLHPDDYEDAEGREEIESTVVHELLHLFFHPLRREAKMGDIAGDIAEEQAINVIADLLVALRRTAKIGLKK